MNAFLADEGLHQACAVLGVNLRDVENKLRVNHLQLSSHPLNRRPKVGRKVPDSYKKHSASPHTLQLRLTLALYSRGLSLGTLDEEMSIVAGQHPKLEAYLAEQNDKVREVVIAIKNKEAELSAAIAANEVIAQQCRGSGYWSHQLVLGKSCSQCGVGFTRSRASPPKVQGRGTGEESRC
ncbi:hypothetical protein [Undibacterium crateris]|uniref:hypothetical protein n=1 Tax=Undibacterium crateris TaxID=2528175 RepID=UPI001F1A97AE|nr:hypothetical protein [Undibacterium crateris]